MVTKSEFRKAKAVELKSSIRYSRGAIVSKALLNKRAGTVTLFAFDTGQFLSEHTAPFDALVQILEGAVQIKIAKRVLMASAGEAVIMPAHIPHALKALKRFKMLLTMIRS